MITKTDAERLRMYVEELLTHRPTFEEMMDSRVDQEAKEYFKGLEEYYKEHPEEIMPERWEGYNVIELSKHLSLIDTLAVLAARHEFSDQCYYIYEDPMSKHAPDDLLGRACESAADGIIEKYGIPAWALEDNEPSPCDLKS